MCSSDLIFVIPSDDQPDSVIRTCICWIDSCTIIRNRYCFGHQAVPYGIRVYVVLAAFDKVWGNFFKRRRLFYNYMQSALMLNSRCCSEHIPGLKIQCRWIWLEQIQLNRLGVFYLPIQKFQMLQRLYNLFCNTFRLCRK